MKIEDYQKAKVLLEDAKNMKNFYDFIIINVQRGKCDRLPKSDIFECGKVLDFIVDYIEAEKKVAMEKAEKMLESI